VKSISGKAFAKLLEKRGWQLARVNGSHHVYVKSGHLVRISVPIHGNQDLKIGLLKHFMKIAGLEEHDLTGH
jgi:predicted RNA binding protein YcfA (HicA-like mRNA interferase family)